MNYPIFAIEGKDGSGKSTAVNVLVDHLKSLGYDVYHTRVPGGTPYCEKLRELLLTNDDQNLMTFSEISTMVNGFESSLKDYYQRKQTNPNLVMVCDRWYQSTFIMQSLKLMLKTLTHDVTDKDIEWIKRITDETFIHKGSAMVMPLGKYTDVDDLIVACHDFCRREYADIGKFDVNRIFDVNVLQLDVSSQTSIQRRPVEGGDYFERDVVHRNLVSYTYDKLAKVATRNATLPGYFGKMAVCNNDHQDLDALADHIKQWVSDELNQS